MPGGTPAMGTHIICYCKDCRAFVRHLGKGDALLDHGGAPVFHTRPDRLRLVAGGEHIKCLRLGPRGALRWYAECCSSPLAASNWRPKLPFVSMSALAAKDKNALGPVVAHAFADQALDSQNTGTPPKTYGTARIIWRVARRAILGRLLGKAGKNPFFVGGKPISAPHVLTREERAAATI